MVGLVQEVRSELKAEIRSPDRKLDSRFNEVLAVVHRTQAMVEEQRADIHRTQALMEEQRGENRIVLDGIKRF